MKKILLILFISCSITNSYAIVATKLAGDCVEILLKNGEKIQVNSVRFTEIDIKYKRCGKAADDPDFSISKLEVESVKTADGKVLFQTNEDIKKNLIDLKRIYNKAAMVSLAMGLISLLIASLALFKVLPSLGLLDEIVFLIPIASIVLGIFALKQFRRRPNEYKGKWMAILGTTFGIIVCLLALAFSLILLLYLFGF